MLKIGCVAGFEADLSVLEAKRVLKDSLQNIDFQFFNSENELVSALAGGELAVALLPLDVVPLALPQGLVITALMARVLPRTDLFFRPAAADSTQPLGLKSGLKMGVLTGMAAQQILDFQADVAVSHYATVSALVADFESGVLESVLLPQNLGAAVALSAAGVSALSLHPRECVPAPGAGTVALLAAAEDRSVRRLLQPLHQPMVAWATNIERKMAQYQPDVAAYCEVDGLNNYHVWAAAVVDGGLKRARWSQSTAFQLPEYCLQELGFAVALPEQ